MLTSSSKKTTMRIPTMAPVLRPETPPIASEGLDKKGQGQREGERKQQQHRPGRKRRSFKVV